MSAILPLYALPLIFPYDSYIGTFANRVWVGNSPEKLKNFRGDHIDWGGESRPETWGFRLRQRSRVRDRAVLTQEAASMKNFARGSVALLLADLAHREHRHPEMRPQTSTKQGKSNALRATHSPTTATEGGHPRVRSVG